MARDDLPPRERIVQGHAEPALASDARGKLGQPRRRAGSMAIAKHDLRRPARPRRHRVEVEQKRGSEPPFGLCQPIGQRLMVRSMNRREARFDLVQRQAPPPQHAVPRGVRRHESKPAAGAVGPWRRALDQERIEIVLGAVAIDRGSRGRRDHRRKAFRQSPPCQPVDERILKRFERGAPATGFGHDPVGVIAPRMRYRQQHGQPDPRRVEKRAGERNAGQGWCVKRATRGQQPASPPVEAGKFEMLSA